MDAELQRKISFAEYALDQAKIGLRNAQESVLYHQEKLERLKLSLSVTETQTDTRQQLNG